ncbi:MAG: Ribonuclease VapC [Acidobacteria bacterium]|nr:Ribonuclease VapC [Acidobacteriota bacterium]
MQRTNVIPVTSEIALAAADLSLEFRLAMADAIILATARTLRAELVSSDRDFERIPGVTYFAKVSAAD